MQSGVESMMPVRKGCSSLDPSGALWNGASAVAQVIERLKYGVEHVVDVLLHQAGLLGVLRRDVALNDIGVRGTKEVEVFTAHGIGINDVIAVIVIGSRADGMRAAHVSRNVRHYRETGGRSTAEPVRSERLVAENRTHGVRAELGGCAIGKEFKNECNFRKCREYTSNVEFKLLIFLLFLVESVELEFLERLVVDDGVVAVRAIVSESANVVEQRVEKVILEVDAVTNVTVAARRGNIAFETAMHGNASSNLAIKLPRWGRDVTGVMTNGQSTNVGVSTGQCCE